MKIKAKILPVVISLILAVGVVTTAWVIQDATVDGITIRTSNKGVELQVKKNESYAKLTKKLTLNADADLVPCVYDGSTFRDADGNSVNDGEHVLQQEIMVSATDKCQLYATVTITGDLPVKVLLNGTDSNGLVNMGTLQNAMAIKIQFYVDGNEYRQDGEATIEIVFHGEKV